MGWDKIRSAFVDDSVASKEDKKGPTLHWKRIDSDFGTFDSVHLYRSKVPGGWLVSSIKPESAGATIGVGSVNTLTFVPDPNHSWLSS